MAQAWTILSMKHGSSHDINDCMANISPLFDARAEIYGKKPEVCQTLIGVDALVDPSFHIEIKVIAQLA